MSGRSRIISLTTDRLGSRGYRPAWTGQLSTKWQCSLLAIDQTYVGHIWCVGIVVKLRGFTRRYVPWQAVDWRGFILWTATGRYLDVASTVDFLLQWAVAIETRSTHGDFVSVHRSCKIWGYHDQEFDFVLRLTIRTKQST